VVIFLDPIHNTLCGSDFGFGQTQPNPAHVHPYVRPSNKIIYMYNFDLLGNSTLRLVSLSFFFLGISPLHYKINKLYTLLLIQLNYSLFYYFLEINKPKITIVNPDPRRIIHKCCCNHRKWGGRRKPILQVTLWFDKLWCMWTFKVIFISVHIKIHNRKHNRNIIICKDSNLEFFIYLF
jgi:hypothetical protein